MEQANRIPGLIKVLHAMYRRHKDWAVRSGFAPMDWESFKRSRMSNDTVGHALQRRARAAA